MKSPMYDFVKLMFKGHIDVKPYVELKVITEYEYQKITGTDYAA